MDSIPQLLFTVADRSYFAILKKEIHALSLSLGFSEERAGKLDIIVAELVSNLVKHANGGQLVVKSINDKVYGEGVELITIDNGPGIGELKKMMQDGVSTKNTLGHGLGAIQRLSDKSEIYTQKDWGTVILSRTYKTEIQQYRKPGQLEISSLIVSKPGQTVCGDGFYYSLTKDNLKIFVGDGLGHGPEAAKAVNKAIERFKLSTENNPVEIIRTLHDYVKKTRGIVATVAIFDFKERSWCICGVGNISTRITSFSSTKNYVAHNGIIGHNIPGTMKAQEVPYEPGQTIILCSDGLKTKWEPSKYPGILKNDLSVLTAVIYKDHTRNNDDASVVAAKITL
jgi:anti-sigma regulatory factor (Ser/Thr protein kinase)